MNHEETFVGNKRRERGTRSKTEGRRPGENEDRGWGNRATHTQEHGEPPGTNGSGKDPNFRERK